jgi:hypothetical protein
MSQANLVQSDLQTVAPYSKYAMNFDGTDEIDIPTITLANDFTISAWVTNTVSGSANDQLLSAGSGFFLFSTAVRNGSTTAGKMTYWNGSSLIAFTDVIRDDNWHHVSLTYNSSTTTLTGYTDGNQTYSETYDAGTNNQINKIGDNLYSHNWLGKISNASIWDTALTSAQVTEIYNEGLPGNLNSHSAYSNLVSWWQLGENSSYVGGATNPWTFADEKGTNNGLSPNLPETALTNGVGTTANGVSTGMSEGNLVGDAPYSTANALSSGMSVVSRVTDVAPSPPPLLLDTYTGSEAAYSLRRLSSSYTGNLIRVTKKVSNVISTTDIGYNSSNELDTTALATFASGADNGEVRVDIWYDQSGNGNNVTQSSFTSCPYIYQSGSLLTSNGKPGIVTAVQTLKTNNQPLSSLQQSGFFVGEPLGIGNYKTIFTHGDYYVFHHSTTTQVAGGKVSIAKYTSSGGDFGVGTQSLLSYYNNSTDIYMRQDGSTIGTKAATPVSYTAKDINFGDFNNVNRAFYGYNQEHIIFPSEQSSNMSGIETNINNYYSIY